MVHLNGLTKDGVARFTRQDKKRFFGLSSDLIFFPVSSYPANHLAGSVPVTVAVKATVMLAKTNLLAVRLLQLLKKVFRTHTPVSVPTGPAF